MGSLGLILPGLTHMTTFIWKVTWEMMGSFGAEQKRQASPCVIFHFRLLPTSMALGLQEDEGGSCTCSGTYIPSLLPYSVSASLKISLDVRSRGIYLL